MKVSKTQTMVVLLSALNIKPYEYRIVDDGIELLLNGQQLLYAINGSEADVQHIFGKTSEWQELCSFYLKGMTK
jgi:hypothetical protein